ncbi:hypothetical protein B9Z65_9037 [Elsinoe australis]|uniref:Uncharacterized protein n=1 Tax=Elsinoe australis TaxID=40998 RepID=A0A2P8ABI1_9PEZI|nr:hypothetical protein B9Z65_9037 [Elsinoe australis]
MPILIRHLEFYLLIILALCTATLLFLTILNTWQFGICQSFPSTCGTSADWAIPGWRHGTLPRHTRTFVPGEGWTVEYKITQEERLQMLKQIEWQVVDMPPIDIEALGLKLSDIEPFIVEDLDSGGEL